ncbi:MAG TPA: dephospho-CoA kinase [Asanoa sp.]|nr:dephospho-CoA kinase [Asanoa sp.]
MLRVGLTGGIGAGKSAAAARFAANGAVVIDSDRLAREVVEPGTPGLAEVVAAFGPGVLRDDGGLDRPALGRIVFGDAAARKRLEGILHPLIQARSAALASAAPAGAIIVNDIPLLVEGGVAAAYHLVVVVDAAPAVRVERLVRDRGMTAADASARIAAQIDDATRRAAADVVLDNSGAPSALDAAADALWSDRLVPFAHNLDEGRPASGVPAVVAYDPTWPAQFDRLAARIRHRVGDLPIAHVGPTAVPGEAVPDVIAMELTAGSAAEADGLRESLRAAGFLPLAGPGGTYANADPGRAAELRVLVG